MQILHIAPPLKHLEYDTYTFQYIEDYIFYFRTVNSVQTFRIVYFNQIDLKSSEASLEIANIWIGGMIKEIDLYFEQGYPE